MMLELLKLPFSGMFIVGVSALSLTLATAGLAQALPPLNQEKHINDSLISAGIAEMIRQNCGSISARILLALRKGKELEQYAMDLGYSKKEINAFIKSDVEKERVRAAVMAYLAANGVVDGKEETYCALGRAEIAKKSLTGQLLWSWK